MTVHNYYNFINLKQNLKMYWSAISAFIAGNYPTPVYIVFRYQRGKEPLLHCHIIQTICYDPSFSCSLWQFDKFGLYQSELKKKTNT